MASVTVSNEGRNTSDLAKKEKAAIDGVDFIIDSDLKNFGPCALLL